MLMLVVSLLSRKSNLAQKKKLMKRIHPLGAWLLSLHREFSSQALCKQNFKSPYWLNDFLEHFFYSTLTSLTYPKKHRFQVIKYSPHSWELSQSNPTRLRIENWQKQVKQQREMIEWWTVSESLSVRDLLRLNEGKNKTPFLFTVVRI